MEQKIRDLLYDLGIVVFKKEKRVSPNCTTVHFDLGDIQQLAQIEKKMKFVSAVLHTDIIVKKSDIGHFAVSFPNSESIKVNFNDEKYNSIFENSLSVFAGIDDKNEICSINLEETPHILVAGTTGSGKSVMMNAIICSLLKQNKFIQDFTLIDTKRVELAPYRKLGDEWCKVATTPQKAIECLKDACDEVEARYAIMEEKGWRKIPNDYYRRFIIIEELGDLMMGSKGLVEKYIVKIAQLGRACGVHLIISTQRPTVDVVTGEIKANIGCRFALQTTSAIDSRNILGHSGAERLKGKGECLLKLPTRADEIHLQCPYISDEDVDNIIYGFLGGEEDEYNQD